MAIESSKLGVFNAINNPNGNGIVQFGDDDKALLTSGGNHSQWNVGARLFSRIGRGVKWFFTGRNENDRIRTQLLRNLVDAIGVEKLTEGAGRNRKASLENGKIKINDELLDALEDLLTPEVFRRKDFQLGYDTNENAAVVSGSPLTERRVTAICAKVKELESRQNPVPVADIQVPAENEPFRSLGQAIKKQNDRLTDLVDSLKGSHDLEGVIKMVLVDIKSEGKKVLSDRYASLYQHMSVEGLGRWVDRVARDIAAAIRGPDPLSACKEAIGEYNQGLSDAYKINRSYLRRCLKIHGAENAAAYYDDNTVYVFLRLLKCAKTLCEGNGPVTLGKLSRTDHALGLSLLRGRWNEMCLRYLPFKRVPVNRGFPEAVDIVKVIVQEGRYVALTKEAVELVIRRRFKHSGIRPPLSKEDIASLANKMCEGLHYYFVEDAGNPKTESGCIDCLFERLNNVELPPNRTFRLTREDARELFYAMFDLLAEYNLVERPRDLLDNGLNRNITREFTFNANGASHNVTSTIEPAIQGNRNFVTNLATSELKGDQDKSLVKFVRFGQRMLYKNKLRNGVLRPRDHPSEAEKKAYYTLIVKEMLRASPSAAVKTNEDDGQARYTVPLYQIDMCGGNEAFLKGLGSFECEVEKRLLDSTDTSDGMQKITVVVHRFRVPTDSGDVLAAEDVAALSGELGALLDEAETRKGGDRKINALYESLSNYKTAVLDPIVQAKQPLSTKGRGGELLQFGSQVAMLACLLGHLPAIHCNLGKDRTGLMDARIKQLATMLEYAPDVPVRRPRQKKPPADEKRLNAEFVVKTGNNTAAKCIEGFSQSDGINLCQANGHSKLHEEYATVLKGDLMGIDQVHEQDGEIILQGQ